jgi:rhodanese-related sulfurtransferase
VPVSIERDEARRLHDEGAQLVDVLPAEEYDVLHIAGAVNVPLRELDERAPRELDSGRPVIVYCNDHF